MSGFLIGWIIGSWASFAITDAEITLGYALGGSLLASLLLVTERIRS